MAAPTPTPRAALTDRPLGDGQGALVTIYLDTDIEFHEKSVTPPGVDTDDPNDTSTNHNVEWRTKSLRKLKTMTDGKATVHYDPSVLDSIVAIIGTPTTLTYLFPDGSTWAVYGGLKSFEPGELMDGQVPEATVTFVHTNTDPITCEEEGPVYTAGSGTSLTC